MSEDQCKNSEIRELQLNPPAVYKSLILPVFFLKSLYTHCRVKEGRAKGKKRERAPRRSVWQTAVDRWWIHIYLDRLMSCQEDCQHSRELSLMLVTHTPLLLAPHPKTHANTCNPGRTEHAFLSIYGTIYIFMCISRKS